MRLQSRVHTTVVTGAGDVTRVSLSISTSIANTHAIVYFFDLTFLPLSIAGKSSRDLGRKTLENVSKPRRLSKRTLRRSVTFNLVFVFIDIIKINFNNNHI